MEGRNRPFLSWRNWPFLCRRNWPFCAKNLPFICGEICLFMQRNWPFLYREIGLFSRNWHSFRALPLLLSCHIKTLLLVYLYHIKPLCNMALHVCFICSVNLLVYVITTIASSSKVPNVNCLLGQLIIGEFCLS